jgi:hypothetical protein
LTLLAILLWPALAASLLLGAGVGWLTGLPRNGPARSGALLLAFATCVAGGLAISGLVPGRAGLWVEGGALILGAYLVGAVILAGLSRRTGAVS